MVGVPGVMLAVWLVGAAVSGVAIAAQLGGTTAAGWHAVYRPHKWDWTWLMKSKPEGATVAEDAAGLLSEGKLGKQPVRLRVRPPGSPPVPLALGAAGGRRRGWRRRRASRPRCTCCR